MKKGTTYTLTDKEWDLAYKTGAARTARALGAKLQYSKIATVQKQEFIDMNGAAGEIALVGMLLQEGCITVPEYTALLDHIYNAGITSAKHGQDDGDVAVQGLNIDAKTTQYDFGTLWITPSKKYAGKISGFALITGDIRKHKPTTYTFRGWMSHAEALEKWDNRMEPGQFAQMELHDLPVQPIYPLTDNGQLPLFYPGREQDAAKRLRWHAHENVYVSRMAEEEYPFQEAKMVAALGTDSGFYDHWLEVCKSCDLWDDSRGDEQLNEVIFEIAREIQEEQTALDFHVDQLVEEHREQRLDEQYERGEIK